MYRLLRQPEGPLGRQRALAGQQRARCSDAPLLFPCFLLCFLDRALIWPVQGDRGQPKTGRWRCKAVGEPAEADRMGAWAQGSICGHPWYTPGHVLRVQTKFTSPCHRALNVFPVHAPRVLPTVPRAMTSRVHIQKRSISGELTNLREHLGKSSA